MRALETWIAAIADAWWVHLVVLALSFADGFFPTVPSESVLVSLAALWASSGTPSILVLALAGWIGAALGDNLAYQIGRSVPWQRLRMFREGRGAHAIATAQRGLERRALLFLMTARYIPFGRTAVNLVAGAVRYPRRDFVARDLLSTFVWAVYCTGVGALAGQWFEDNRTLGILVALVVAVALSLLLERVVGAIHGRLDRRFAARHGDRDAAARLGGERENGDGSHAAPVETVEHVDPDRPSTSATAMRGSA